MSSGSSQKHHSPKGNKAETQHAPPAPSGPVINRQPSAQDQTLPEASSSHSSLPRSQGIEPYPGYQDEWPASGSRSAHTEFDTSPDVGSRDAQNELDTVVKSVGSASAHELAGRKSTDTDSSTSGDKYETTGIRFCCTFCPKTFSTSQDWRRHEFERHVQPSKWVCQPSTQNSQGIQLCSFCDQDVEKTSCPHDVQTCWARKDRIFKRKRQLQKHFELVHHLSTQKIDDILPRFQVDITVDPNNVDLTCYFCDYGCSSWNDRANHVNNHFLMEPVTKRDWDARKETLRRNRALEART